MKDKKEKEENKAPFDIEKEKTEKLDFFINRGDTGNMKQLAAKMSFCERRMYNEMDIYNDRLKKFNVFVFFNKSDNTFQYSRPGNSSMDFTFTDKVT